MPDDEQHMPNPFDDDDKPEGHVDPPRPATDGEGGSSDDDSQPDDTGATGTLGDGS